MLDRPLYRNSFSTAAMRRIWSEDETLASWIAVEQVLARCQSELGLIPQEAARRIGGISADQIDRNRLAGEMDLVGRPIVGLVGQMRGLVGDASAAYVHYRATTQDIIDTAMAMQMRDGLDEIVASIDRMVLRLEYLTEDHGDARMIGRTNGQHAVPMDFATRLLVWISELRRRRQALMEAAGRGLLVQIGGPVGDLGRYEGDTGPALKQKVAAALDLGTAEPHWQNARDGVADIVTALGALCASLCKIAHNVNLLASSDIGEVCEGHSDGRGASSSMAHKRNQRATEFGEAVARLGRQRSEQIQEVCLHQHERSGGVWIAEWMIVPEVFLLTSGALMWAERLFDGLQVDAHRMAANLQAHLDGLASSRSV